MRLTAQDAWSPPSGDAVVWQVPVWEGSTEPVSLSINQLNHASAARTAGPVWLAIQVRLPVPAPSASVAAAVETVLRRHDAMHVVVPGVSDGDLAARRVPTEAVRLEPVLEGRSGTVDLGAAIDLACDLRRGAPAVALVTVQGESGTSVVLAADHLYVDAISVVLLAAELVTVLSGSAEVVQPGGADLGRHEPAQAPLEPIGTQDPRVRLWADLLELTGSRPPTFPLPLDLGPGELARQVTIAGPLATRIDVDHLEALGRRDGASVFAVLLAGLHDALRERGAAPEVPVVVPVQTRSRHESRRVGWFTTSIPVVLGDSAPGLSPVAAAQAALRAGLTTAGVPLDQLLASLPTPLQRGRHDVFMVSYLDYRRVAGWDVIAPLDPLHISRSTDCDDVQIWITRSDDGLWVRVRLPGTAAIEDTVRSVLEAWTAGLSGLLTTV